MELKTQCQERLQKALQDGDLEEAKFWKYAVEKVEIFITALAE